MDEETSQTVVSSVCFEDQLKAYRLKQQPANIAKQPPISIQPPKIQIAHPCFDDQIKKYKQKHKKFSQNQAKKSINPVRQLSPNHVIADHLSVAGKIDEASNTNNKEEAGKIEKQLQDYRSRQNHVFKHQYQASEDSNKHQASHAGHSILRHFRDNLTDEKDRIKNITLKSNVNLEEIVNSTLFRYYPTGKMDHIKAIVTILNLNTNPSRSTAALRHLRNHLADEMDCIKGTTKIFSG
jgi:hydroxylamine reductase (hybrid-cluster protein)